MAEDEKRADRAQTRAQALGTTGERVAGNLATLRAARGLSTTQLSAAVEQLGRPIPPTGITKIEKRVRRVDVDDLIALALALNVSPNRLLLPDPAWEGDVALTGVVEHDNEAAWRWACGERPLLDENATERVRRAETVKFSASNRLPGPSPDLAKRALETLARLPAFMESMGEEEDGQGLD